MTSIQLQIIRPGGQVRRETFSQGPVAFGREGDNQIIFAESFVSRRHGAFHQDQDRWLLENLSDNGTQLNGKRIKRPVPVSAGDIISIGDQEIFRVEALLPSSRTLPLPAGEGVESGRPAAATASPAGHKTKLWISLAGFWVVVLALLVFVQPLLVNKDNTGADRHAPELTHEQITQAVRRKPADIAGAVQPNERQMKEALIRARDISSRMDSRIDATYQAYRAYQRAIAFSGKNMLDDSRDMREFTLLEPKLIDGVTERYYDAYAKLRTQNYRGAEAAFRDLTSYFPEPQNPLIQNVEALRKDIGSRLKRRR